jgi:hypothetical protein
MERLQPYENHTEAFNAVMTVFGYRTFNIFQYHDLGSFASYQAFIRGA